MLSLRKDVLFSWDLLHVLPHNYEKILSVLWTFERTYGRPIEESYARKVITELVHAGLVDAKRNQGIRAKRQCIISFLDVLKALEVKYRWTNSQPSGKIINRVHDIFRTTEIVNP